MRDASHRLLTCDENYYWYYLVENKALMKINTYTQITLATAFGDREGDMVTGAAAVPYIEFAATTSRLCKRNHFL